MTTVTLTAVAVTSCTATAADPIDVTKASHGLSTSDLVLATSFTEMTELNGGIFSVEEGVDANSLFLRGAAGVTRIDASGFTAETTGGTLIPAVSSILTVAKSGEDITFALTGTWVGTIQFQREKTPGSNIWITVAQYTANVSRVWQQTRENERYRGIMTAYTSGSPTITISDGDKVVQTYVDAEGIPIFETTEAGMTIPGTLAVTGATILTGGMTGDVTGDLTGDVNAVTVDVEVIEAGDASLGINGLDAAQGGDIVIFGGRSSTAGNAGGDVSLKGGNPGATSSGGVVSVTGGIGGATSGVGGAVSITGGVGTNNNDDGGVVTIAGGAPHGSGAAGVLNINGAIRNTTNIGAVPGTVTAVEFGDGYNHVTVLTVTAAVLVPDIPADAEEVGALIYTFPAGVHQVHSVHMKITAITEGANTVAVDIGCGSTLAAGDGATLQATTDEDFLDGQTIADSSSPAIEKSLAADGTVFEASDSKLFHINLAATWIATEADPDITGTVTIRWSFLGV